MTAVSLRLFFISTGSKWHNLCNPVKRGWYFSMKKHPILRMTSWLIFKIRGAVISFNTVP